MRRLLLKITAVVFVCGFFTYWYFMFTGPQMQHQIHIRAYEQRMPLPPSGAVPVEPDGQALPSARQAATRERPVPDTPDNRARGKVYYEYYCIFCHGESGQGNGPVGNGYMPKPTDLRDPKVLRKSDGELFVSMLTGPGHEPVLSRVIPQGHRWYLVLYVRALRETPASPVQEANRPHQVGENQIPIHKSQS
ncbi:MAG: hypothetical protein A4E73_02992 [Syntrophaceae bacterium PtaU1.Bin231]|nr:MAG: hypothetical protein A4E73_02992 [Syntrophaceae bacterium PtaU1.Bin231]